MMINYLTTYTAQLGQNSRDSWYYNFSFHEMKISIIVYTLCNLERLFYHYGNFMEYITVLNKYIKFIFYEIKYITS